MMHPAAALWRTALERVDRWFGETVSRLPDVIPCHPGCSACCHGPFDISVADALLLREGLGSLPAPERAAIRVRGQSLLDRMREAAPGWRPPWDLAHLGEDRFDAVADSLAGEPCPLLDDDGRCVVYAWRPLVCRLMGLPMMTAGGIVLDNACPIQGRFPVYAALDPQLFDLEALEEEENACLEGAAMAFFDSPLYRGYETTIAAIAAE
jgi:Fe-S-cluster containining protein